MNAREIIEKYQDKSKYDLCCSESIMHAGNEYFNLNLSADALKMSASFCGGNLSEDTCGLFTSSISLIAIMYCENVSHQSTLMREYIKQFKTEFVELLGNDNCKLLKEKYRDANFGCKSIVIEVFLLLTKFIDEKNSHSSLL